MFTVSSAKITGNPDSSGWVQVHEFSPEEPEKMASRGHLFAVISTNQVGEGIDEALKGREILARFHEEYYGKTEISCFNALKNATEKIMTEFSLGGEVEICAVVILADAVYSSVGGWSKVLILRNGMLATILEGKTSGVVCASGYPKENDILILGTKNFFNSLSEGVVKAALESGTPATAGEMLSPAIHSQKDSGTSGAVIIKFNQENQFIVQPEKTDLPNPAINTSGFKAQGALFFKNIGHNFGRFIFNKFSRKKIYVRPDDLIEEIPQKKRVVLSVGIVLIILLLVSIVFGIRQKNLKEQKGKYATRLNQAVSDIDQAINLASLEPGKAREFFGKSKVVADELKNEGVKDDLLQELVKKLEQNEGMILGEYRSQTQPFSDLSLQTSGFLGNQIVFSGQKIFVFDKNSKKAVSVEFETKKTETVAGPEQLDDTLSITAYQDRLFSLTQLGIFEITKQGKNKVIEKDWAGEVIPSAYAGNIYLVDKAGNMIWRYIGAKESFGTKQKWLGPGVSSDFSDISNITIDGAIWMINPSGRISKYLAGSPQNLINPRPAELVSAQGIYSNEELKYVYILDKSSKKVVVFEKNGEYKANYSSEEIGNSLGLVVSEKDKKIILLTGDKLLSIDLKHL